MLDDLRNMNADWGKPAAAVAAKAAVKAAFYPAVEAVILYRIGAALYRHKATRPLAHLCKSRAIRRAGADIHPAAQIGPGFQLVHSVGIVIGHQVKAGRNLVVYQGVTLGYSAKAGGGQPVIGDNVRIYAGAKVLGSIHVGDGATVAANAVVLADVPAGATVSGVWTTRSSG